MAGRDQVIVIERPVHEWFALTRSAYLVLPRLALEAMPVEWQHRFVALMDEAEAMGLTTPSDYEVRRRDDTGRYIEDPWANYRRGDFGAVHGKPLSEVSP
ncbi:hypothetical protein [Azospirillum sp.]|uniref:hypothetical protein n=1 Tax=Azospirillum sp. TaxID=34012 RepID=UPI003D742C6E